MAKLCRVFDCDFQHAVLTKRLAKNIAMKKASDGGECRQMRSKQAFALI